MNSHTLQALLVQDWLLVLAPEKGPPQLGSCVYALSLCLVLVDSGAELWDFLRSSGLVVRTPNFWWVGLYVPNLYYPPSGMFFSLLCYFLAVVTYAANPGCWDAVYYSDQALITQVLSREECDASNPAGTLTDFSVELNFGQSPPDGTALEDNWLAALFPSPLTFFALAFPPPCWGFSFFFLYCLPLSSSDSAAVFSSCSNFP